MIDVHAAALHLYLKQKGFPVTFACPMSAQPGLDSSRVWSCNTLKDGIDRLMEKVTELDDEEDNLKRLIEDSLYIYHLIEQKILNCFENL